MQRIFRCRRLNMRACAINPSPILSPGPSGQGPATLSLACLAAWLLASIMALGDLKECNFLLPDASFFLDSLWISSIPPSIPPATLAFSNFVSSA